MGRRNGNSVWDELRRHARSFLHWRSLLVLGPLVTLVVLNTTEYWIPLMPWIPWVDTSERCSSREQGISISDQMLFRGLMIPHRQPSEPKIALVTMGDVPGVDLLTDLCSGRRFTADLIDALNRAGVAAIALDKIYGQKSCGQSDANERLRAAAGREGGAKMVVGQGTHTNGPDACLVKSEDFDFHTQNVQRGITKLNTDSLKIPLRWPVFKNDAEAKPGVKALDEGGASFALATAKLVEPGIEKDKQIKLNLARSSHPYGEYRTQIQPIDAAHVLCGDAIGTKAYEAWSGKCRSSQPVRLRGLTVVVANESDRDMHPFLDADTPGAEIQARYINALLTKRFYSELPFWGCFWALVGWIVFVLLVRGLFTTEANARCVLYILLAGYVVAAALLMIVPQMYKTVPPFSFILAAGLMMSFEWAGFVLERRRKKILS